MFFKKKKPFSRKPLEVKEGNVERIKKLTESLPPVALVSLITNSDNANTTIEYGNGVVSYGLYKETKGAASYVELAKGSVVKEHIHDQKEVLVIITGVLEFTCDGVKEILNSGDVLIIPPNISHCPAVALEDTTIFAITIPADMEGFPDAKV